MLAIVVFSIVNTSNMYNTNKILRELGYLVNMYKHTKQYVLKHCIVSAAHQIHKQQNIDDYVPSLRCVFSENRHS